MGSVYLYFFAFLAIALVFCFVKKTRVIGIVLILSYISLFPLSYFLHDHFYFWKMKNSNIYIETISDMTCYQLKAKGEIDSNMSISLGKISNQISINKNGHNIYQNLSDNVFVPTNTYKCGDFEINFDLSPKRKWYQSYFYYFKALANGEVVNVTKHKYWDFILLHIAILLFWASFVLYRLFVMQDMILSSVEEVIENGL